MLNKSIEIAKLSIYSYKSHSFRIGAATDRIVEGKQDSVIKELGRLSSCAINIIMVSCVGEEKRIWIIGVFSMLDSRWIMHIWILADSFLVFFSRVRVE